MPRAAAALAVLVVLALALVVGQLVLPGVAERQLREDLADSGDVQRVDVRAFPAVKLLFHRADRVTVRMGEARAQPGRFADLLARTKDTARLEATATTMKVGPLQVRDLRLTKEDDRLEGEAAVSEADLAQALPFGLDVRPVVEAGGALLFEVSAGAFGSAVAVRVRLSARDGDLRLAPEGLLGGFAALTVFSDPRIEVRRVGARPRAGGYTFTAAARLRS